MIAFYIILFLIAIYIGYVAITIYKGRCIGCFAKSKTMHCKWCQEYYADYDDYD